MCYTMFYPKDVDVSVPYVGPVARAQEDGRHEPFLRDSTGTAEDRAIIYNFQLEILKRSAAMEQKLSEWSEKNKVTYNISIPEVLDYCVLEFPFAFWQWGRKTSTIPATTETDDVLFKYFVDAVGLTTSRAGTTTHRSLCRPQRYSDSSATLPSRSRGC